MKGISVMSDPKDSAAETSEGLELSDDQLTDVAGGAALNARAV